MRVRPFWIAVAAAAALAAGCGGDDGSGPDYGGNNNNPPGGSTSSSISVRNNSFDPRATTVPVGTTVTWTWVANADLHNVTFADGTASPTQSSGTYPRTFSTAGSYAYNCTRHPGMTGTVTVQ